MVKRVRDTYNRNKNAVAASCVFGTSSVFCLLAVNGDPSVSFTADSSPNRGAKIVRDHPMRCEPHGVVITHYTIIYYITLYYTTHNTRRALSAEVQKPRDDADVRLIHHAGGLAIQ